MTGEGAHTPLPYGLAQHIDIRASVQARTAPISGFSSELILNRKKEEREDTGLQVLEAVRKVFIELCVIKVQSNHRNKTLQHLLHVMPGPRFMQ